MHTHVPTPNARYDEEARKHGRDCNFTEDGVEVEVESSEDEEEEFDENEKRTCRFKGVYWSKARKRCVLNMIVYSIHFTHTHHLHFTSLARCLTHHPAPPAYSLSWQATIRINGKEKHLALFKNQVNAAKRQVASIEFAYHGLGRYCAAYSVVELN